MKNLPIITQLSLDSNTTGVFINLDNIMMENPIGQSRFIDPKSILFIKNGMLHHDQDFPALISPDRKTVSYYKNGTFHRENSKPALIVSSLPYIENEGNYTPDPETNDLALHWFEHGLHHNLSAPAIIAVNGKQFYIRDKLLSEEAFQTHPDVISHRNKLALKKKMNQEFSE